MVEDIRITQAIEPGSPVELEHYGLVTIDNLIGSGGSCLAYSAHYLQRDERRNLVLKEYYPERMANGNRIRRNQETQCIEPVGERNSTEYEDNLSDFEDLKERFLAGADRQIHYSEIDSRHHLPVDIDKSKNGNLYLITRLQNGKRLDLARTELRSSRKVYEVVNSLLNALKLIHDNEPKSLHLDIKPENIFLFEEAIGATMEIALFDFDTVVAIKALNEPETRISLSTPWAAPEQIRKATNEMGPWTDIYAVGLILFWLLFGEIPSERILEDIRNYSFESSEYFQAHHFDIRAEAECLILNNVLGETLSLEPRSRFPTISEFQGEIGKLIEHSYDGEALSRKQDITNLKLVTINSQIKDIFLNQKETSESLKKQEAYFGRFREETTAGLVKHEVQDNLPMNGREFIGRIADFEAIGDRLTRKGIMVISGVAGIGKSELALEYARRERDDKGTYTRVVFLEYQKNMATTLADKLPVSHVRGSFGNRDTHLEIKLEALEQCGKETLIILDSLEDFDSKNPEERSIYQTLCSGGKRLLITTRNTKTPEGDRAYSLESLRDEELLELYSKLREGALSQQEQQVLIQRLIPLLAGNTLVLTLIAKLMLKATNLDLATLCSQLEANEPVSAPQRIFHSKVGQSQSSNDTLEAHLDTLLNISLLSQAEVTLLMFLSLMPPEGVEQSMFLELLPSYKNASLEDFDETLDNLLTHGWVKLSIIDEQRIVSNHTLVRNAICKRWKWNQKGLSDFCYKLNQYMAAIYEGPSSKRIEEFITIARSFIGKEQEESIHFACLLANITDIMTWYIGEVPTEYLRRAIEITTSKTPGKRRLLAELQLRLCKALVYYGDDQALKELEDTMALLYEVYPSGHSMFSIYQGMIDAISGESSLDEASEPIEALNNDENPNEKLETLSALSVLNIINKDYKELINTANDIAELSKSKSTKRSSAILLMQSRMLVMGSYVSLGNYQEALELSHNLLYDSQLILMPPRLTVSVLQVMGHCYLELEDKDKAAYVFDDLHSRLDVWSQDNKLMPWLDGEYSDLGAFYELLGKPEKALVCYNQVLQHAEAKLPKDNEGIVGAHLDIADCYEAMQDFRAAIEHQQKALATLNASPDSTRHDKAKPTRILGYLYRRAGEYQNAERRFNEALTLYDTESPSYTNEVYLVHLGLAFTFFLDECYDKALEQFKICLETIEAESAPSPDVLIDLHEWVSTVYDKIGDTARAAEHKTAADALKDDNPELENEER